MFLRAPLAAAPSFTGGVLVFSGDDNRSDFCVSDQYVPAGDFRQYAWGAEWGRISSGPVYDAARWRDVWHAQHVKHVYRRRSRTSLLCDRVGIAVDFVPRYEYVAVMLVKGKGSPAPVPFLMTGDTAGGAVDKAVALFRPLEGTQPRGNLELLAVSIADDLHLAWMYARINRHIKSLFGEGDQDSQPAQPVGVDESVDLLHAASD